MRGFGFAPARMCDAVCVCEMLVYMLVPGEKERDRERETERNFIIAMQSLSRKESSTVLKCTLVQFLSPDNSKSAASRGGA